MSKATVQRRYLGFITWGGGQAVGKCNVAGCAFECSGLDANNERALDKCKLSLSRHMEESHQRHKPPYSFEIVKQGVLYE